MGSLSEALRGQERTDGQVLAQEARSCGRAEAPVVARGLLCSPEDRYGRIGPEPEGVRVVLAAHWSSGGGADRQGPASGLHRAFLRSCPLPTAQACPTQPFGSYRELLKGSMRRGRVRSTGLRTVPRLLLPARWLKSGPGCAAGPPPRGGPIVCAKRGCSRGLSCRTAARLHMYIFAAKRAARTQHAASSPVPKSRLATPHFSAT